MRRAGSASQAGTQLPDLFVHLGAAHAQQLGDEQGRERGYHMIWIEHDLMDPRTVSRKTMRDKVNEYMRTVMKAEPVDPSLVEFEDEVCM